MQFTITYVAGIYW